jgi:hypothetical protein
MMRETKVRVVAVANVVGAVIEALDDVQIIHISSLQLHTRSFLKAGYRAQKAKSQPHGRLALLGIYLTSSVFFSRQRTAGFGKRRTT